MAARFKNALQDVAPVLDTATAGCRQPGEQGGNGPAGVPAANMDEAAAPYGVSLPNGKEVYVPVYVFVLSKTGKRLMPTHAAKAKKLLKAKKAKIVSRNPFTIQLTYETTEYTQELIAKLDTGFKKAGVALQANNKVVFQGEIVHRRYINQPTKGQVLAVRRQRRLSSGRLNARVLKTGRRLVNVTPDRLHVVERAKGLTFIPRKEARPALLP